ncbi:NTP transferase domain-containing protein [Candidatus Woesearchaeota archaeon]|nr:NTP transferase domain-containing protein [Candidatus Woesearchaeota archaeon]
MQKQNKTLQAVILCAGKSTRTYPLTLTRPKTLLSIANSPIIRYFLDNLSGLVDEVIIVVNYMKEMIIKEVGDSYKGMKIVFVEQKQMLGTADAVIAAESYIKDKFLLMYGDDLYSQEDFKQILKHEYALLAKKVEDPRLFGIIQTKNNKALGIIEKPAANIDIGNLANVGVFMLDKSIFAYKNKIKKSSRDEFELTDMLSLMMKDKSFAIVEAQQWIPITYAWSLLEANEILLNKLTKSEIKGNVEKNAAIKGIVILGKNSIIKNGAYLEGTIIIGENCTIGPNCYIRGPTAIGNNCKVGNAVEIKASILFDNVHVGHLSYVGDSVIGEKVNFGAGSIIANLRHDNKTVQSFINGKKIDSGRRKLGAIIGDNVHLSIKTAIYPGRKIWPDIDTAPCEIIKIDKMKQWKGED